MRGVKSQSALPCDAHIFLLLLLLIVFFPIIFFFPHLWVRPESEEVNDILPGMPDGPRTSQSPEGLPMQPSGRLFTHTDI